MITAIVLISADVDRIPEVAQEIADLDGVTEVYSVAGDADLIALVRVRQHEDLADVIADRLNKVKGVTGRRRTSPSAPTPSTTSRRPSASDSTDVRAGAAAQPACEWRRPIRRGWPGPHPKRSSPPPGAPQRQWLP